MTEKTTIRGAYVRSALFGVPWAMVPAQLEVLGDVVDAWCAGTNVPMLAQDAPAARVLSGGVAVLPVLGAVGHRMNMMSEMSGGTSLQQLLGNYRAMMADDAVGAILLEIDSPGGTTSGLAETVDEMRSFRGRKPVVALANTMMASAAYWLGSVADHVMATPSAHVGSIGVYTLHQDASAAYEDAGVKNTLISAGEFKAEASEFEPLSDNARMHVQALVNHAYDQFVAAVAENRGVSENLVREGYGKGRVLPASAALSAGLVDSVGTFDDAVRLAFSKAENRERSARADVFLKQQSALLTRTEDAEHA